MRGPFSIPPLSPWGRGEINRRLPMPRTASPAPLLTPHLNPAAAAPLFRQLYDALRQAILAGTLRPGGRLPATRTLAAELGVSRNTIVTAYEQLLAEGYLTGRVGSGSYVTLELPDDAPRLPDGGPANGPAAAPARGLSRRGARLAGAPACNAWPGSAGRLFRPGLPALDAFPFALWERLSL